MSAPTGKVQGARDDGFTLVELLLVVIISGVLVVALATAISVALRTTPSTEERIDDARSTRSLSTYLAEDATSTPAFAPERPQGGFDVSTVDGPANNDCGGPGTNIVHMQWTETIVTERTYVANYRFVVEDGSARVRRIECSADVGDPYTVDFSRDLTPALDPSAAPVASLTLNSEGEVELLTFTLTGKTGETVLVEVASRNPSEFFPS